MVRPPLVPASFSRRRVPVGSLRRESPFTVPPGACTDVRGWLFDCLGTTFRRWASGCRPSFRLCSLGRSSSSVSFLCCAYRSVGRNKTSLVLNHQLYKNSELAQVSHNYLFGRYSQIIESKGNLSGSTLNCFYVLSLLYLRKSAACLAVYSSGVGLSLGSGDHVSLMGALSVPGLLCRLVCAWSRRVTWLFSVGTLTWFLVRF